MTAVSKAQKPVLKTFKSFLACSFVFSKERVRNCLKCLNNKSASAAVEIIDNRENWIVKIIFLKFGD